MQLDFHSLIHVLYPDMRVSPNLDRSAHDFTLGNLPLEAGTTDDVLPIANYLHRISDSIDPHSPTVVILAGGRGSRMEQKYNQKVLAPIDGVPALLRSVDTYRQFNFKNFVFIVGYGYKAVIQSLQKYTHINKIFLFQDKQSGTGHAAGFASRYLDSVGYQGDILVTMGDKVITSSGMQQLSQTHATQQPDLTITTASKAAWPDAGRIVLNTLGQVATIIEKPDIVLKRFIGDLLELPDEPIPSNSIQQRALAYWNRKKKWKKILPEGLWDYLEKNTQVIPQDILRFFENPNPFLPIDAIESRHATDIENQSGEVNVSLYYFKSEAFYTSMKHIEPDNAQHEYYLTDAVSYLVNNANEHNYNVICSRTRNDYDVMGFNTEDERLLIEEKIQQGVIAT